MQYLPYRQAYGHLLFPAAELHVGCHNRLDHILSRDNLLHRLPPTITPTRSLKHYN